MSAITSAPPAIASDISELFPYISLRSYLNTASVGLSWAGCASASNEFYGHVKSMGLDGQPVWAERTARTVDQLAALLDVAATGLQFVGSATEAMNLLAHGITLGEHDHVLILDDDHDAVIQPWLSAGSSGRFSVDPLPRQRSAPTRTGRLLDAIKSNTSVVAVSHTDAVTGEAVNLSQLADACSAAGALLIVDGSQSTGAIPVSVARVDAYLGSVFKWLISGFGLGYLYMSPQMNHRIKPLWRGGSNVPPSRSLRYGHLNLGGIYTLSASLTLMGDLGWSQIHARIRRLSDVLRDGLLEAGFKLLCNDPAAGIVAVQSDDPQALQVRLNDAGVVVQAHPQSIRISPHFYNKEQDIHQCLEALKALR